MTSQCLRLWVKHKENLYVISLAMREVPKYDENQSNRFRDGKHFKIHNKNKNKLFKIKIYRAN